MVGVAAVFAVLLVLALVNPPRVFVVLTGEKDATVEYASKYQDPGAKAFFGAKFYPEKLAVLPVKTTGMVDTRKIGDYTLTYSAKWWIFDGKNVRHVHVKDSTAPEIALNGGDTMTILAGDKFVDPGVTARDNVDGDISAKVKVSGNVDTATPGTYTLTYKIADSSGNTAETSRTVTVSSENKVVYLTFDDGPSAATPRLLDILKSRGVHATFFVTGYGDSSLIGRAAREGHSIGIHTMTHNYNKVYASEKAYLADLNAIAEVIKTQTGKPTHLLRFPGGSSNTVSSITPGLMTRLVQELPRMGYHYFDWNVESGDAGRVNTTQEVFNNVIAGMQAHKVSLVLQHDTHDFSVDAVGQIIDWGLAHGYTFLPLDESSPGMHHRVAN